MTNNNNNKNFVVSCMNLLKNVESQMLLQIHFLFIYNFGNTLMWFILEIILKLLYVWIIVTSNLVVYENEKDMVDRRKVFQSFNTNNLYPTF
jgi:hypothetical protein